MNSASDKVIGMILKSSLLVTERVMPVLDMTVRRVGS
jgi:hypothetical protein